MHSDEGHFNPTPPWRSLRKSPVDSKKKASGAYGSLLVCYELINPAAADMGCSTVAVVASKYNSAPLSPPRAARLRNMQRLLTELQQGP